MEVPSIPPKAERIGYTRLVGVVNDYLKRVWMSPATYTVCENSQGTFDAVNGKTHKVDSNDANGAVVINDVWENHMPKGGKIHAKGTINQGSVPIELDLIHGQKDLILTGEGETGTVFNYAGTGHAIKVLTDDEIVVYYNFLLEDFTIHCGNKTSGRHCLGLDKVGRLGVIQRVKAFNGDVNFEMGLEPNDTNNLIFRDCDAIGGNINFKNDNAATNELTFDHCNSKGSSVKAFDIQGATSVRWFGGLTNPASGRGISLDGARASIIYGHRFEAMHSVEADLYVEGGQLGLDVINCYWNGNGGGSKLVPYGVYIKDGQNIAIRGGSTRFHGTSFFYIDNNDTSLTVDNLEHSQEDVMFDSPTLTKLNSRFAGSWFEPRRQGLIVYNMGEDPLVEGDVVIPYGGGGVGPNWSAGQSQPRAVMIPGAASKPVVVCINGITKVNINGAAASLNDTLKTSDTAKIAVVDNTLTDSKFVLGYLHKNCGAGDLADVKVLG